MMPAVCKPPAYGVVAIGRNEGERLKRCLSSVSDAALTVYVDSGSSDGSMEWATSRGIEVVELDTAASFTAARARNAGFARLMELAPDLLYVQFVDGDCEMISDWPAQAIEFLACHARAAVVFGRRRERHPERSPYNWLCDQEWSGQPGEVRYCGGDIMARTEALRALGGYRDTMIAGEEPELCVRLRAAGWSIWRIEQEMTRHDANLLRFGQWWRRTLRSGYAFAEGSHLHGAPPERFWVWESRRALIWGLGLPLAVLATLAAIGPIGLALLLLLPLQVLRQTLRGSGPWQERFKLALFQLMARFPEAIGQMKFRVNRLNCSSQEIIEYK
ncbi:MULTISPECIES: glycosyltransferase family 2 protein [unclassified Bradyrhizobium]|uniref:glycosyltransferase family 2 protein n=2 Tax=unclassified Bradyrhizobium TaxID=2631580 RepID=UPI0028F07F46|nr:MULTISPECIES: glycosyltransferase family 2 protein [unclassified Bradyrhizobium]